MNSWNQKRVVVTGAGGFIGSHLAEELVRRGADVTAMVHYNALNSLGNLRFAAPELRRLLKIAAGNIEDVEFVASTLDGNDVVFHLAALIGIPYSYVAPRSYVRTNIEGTINVLEAVRRGMVGLAINTSTSEVYGTAMREPIDEEHPLQGQSPYSATKIAADKLAEAYWRSFNVNVVTVRPFNTFGPRQSARAFIPTIIVQALTLPEIRLGSLAPQRDMTYVADTVEGFLAAAATTGLAGETINLGTGITASVGEFAERIKLLMGIDKPLVQDPQRVRPEKSEVMRLISSNLKAKRLMGWAPQIDLNTGLERTIEFFSSNLDLYQSTKYAI